jgi:cytochrome c-type biogenesis protein CcsB
MHMALFIAALSLYGAAAALFVGYAFTRRESLAGIATGAVVAGVVTQAVFISLRTAFAHHLPGHAWYVPWSSWFESFSFLALVMAVQFLLIERRRLPVLGVFILPIVFAGMVVALRSPTGTAVPEIPRGLDSRWLAAHIPVMFVAYAAFGHAFAVGLAYLLQESQLKSKNPTRLAFRLPPLDELDRLISRIIAWAFPALTVGLLLGSRWAYDIWGRYWTWDAKETAALITWLVYLGYLVLRAAGGWRGRKTAYLSLAGFAVMMFTYVGANHLSRFHAFLPGGGR